MDRRRNHTEEDKGHATSSPDSGLERAPRAEHVDVNHCGGWV